MGNKAGGKAKRDLTILTEEDIQLLEKNTRYTKEEIISWHTGFLKDCPTGKLDKKQFLNVYKVIYFEEKIPTTRKIENPRTKSTLFVLLEILS